MKMRHAAIVSMAAVFAAGSCTGRAADADLLGLYIGGALGQSDVRLHRTYAGTAYPFSEDHTGWKAIVGIRPVPIFGAEIEYMDFGNPTYAPPMTEESWHTNTKATALFGTLYAPIPIPFFDVYGKLGVARLRSDVTTYYYGPIPEGFRCYPAGVAYCEGRIDRSDTGLAFGAGVQFRFRPVALRIEYEQIDSSIGDPNMASLGLTWTF